MVKIFIHSIPICSQFVTFCIFYDILNLLKNTILDTLIIYDKNTELIYQLKVY